LILTDNLEQIIALYRAHGSLPEVILGNLHDHGQSRPLAPTVYCDQGELEAIDFLLSHDVIIQTCSGAGDLPQKLSRNSWQH